VRKRFTVWAAVAAGALIAAGLVATPIQAAPPVDPPAAENDPVTEDVARARGDSALQEHQETLRASPDDRFAVWRTIVDDDGASHVRYTRTYKGLPVRGGDVVVHHASGGRFNGASVAQNQTIALDTQPQVARAAAATAARAHFDGTATGVATPELVVDATGDAARLAWEAKVTGTGPDGQTPSRLRVRVDAATGTVLSAHDEVHTDTDSTVNGVTIYSGTVPVKVTPMMGSGYWLSDPATGAHTCDVHNKWDATVCDTFVGFGTSIGGTHPGNRATAGVDAHYGAALTFDYFKNKHKRNGIFHDGQGVKSRVHYGNDYVNAFWDPDCRCMTYGDGDQNQRPLVAIDVAGHEMSHGITANSVTGDLEYHGESGGLNEATSDIFATMVEFYANNSNDGFDYRIGEEVDIFGTGAPLRYMFQPSLDGKSPDCWDANTKNLNVHYSSGVGNHFFFMLAEGSGFTAYGFSPVCGSAPAVLGIGRDKAAAIWYRALDTYFTSTTQYVSTTNNSARAYTLAAAADLYGYCGPEYRAVRAAWRAAGVNGSDQTCQTTPVFGWVLANQPLTTGYTPATQQNSTGSANTITRSSAGNYVVRYAGLNGGLGVSKGGTIHVTAFAGQHNCKVVTWYGSGDDIIAPVACYDNAGNSADGQFTASFTRARPGGTFAYAWAGSPTTPSYQANSNWSYNGAPDDGPTVIDRLGTGHYKVTFSKLGVAGGTAMVTAQGYDNTMCAVDTWLPSGTDEAVYVWCTDPQGTPRDAAFDVTFVNEMSIVGTGQPSAYAWVTQVTGTLGPTYAFNSTANVNSSTHTPGSGEYLVRIPGIFAVDGIPHVVAQSQLPSGIRCRVAAYYALPTVGTEVRVRCATPTGAPADAYFDLAYVE
jgi:Zn-dependent metalloprotease